MSTTFVRPGVIILLCLSFFTSLGQSDQDAINAINGHRKKQQEEMRNPKKSPLSKKDRRHFKELNYFPIDLSYRVKARFVKTENPVFFKMKTTTVRIH